RLTGSAVHIDRTAPLPGACRSSGSPGVRDTRRKTTTARIIPRQEDACPGPIHGVRKPGCRVATVRGGFAMYDQQPTVGPTHPPPAELDRLGDEIAELSAHLDAATARLLDLVREFDARGGWNTGFRSCAAWLSWRVGLDPGAARERVRVARALGTLPLLAGALARGELSYAKARALTRVAPPETEDRLLAVGRAGTAAHVERIARGWRQVDRQAEARETERRHASRALHLFHDEDGMVVLR